MAGKAKGPVKPAIHRNVVEMLTARALMRVG